MKKINSIGYAHKIIGLVILFLIVLPFCCNIFNSVFYIGLFTALMYISFVIGGFILLVFIGLLGLEFYQDRKIDQQYINIRKKKLALGNGFYECQACGSRQVRSIDKNCSICGTQFNTEGGSH